MWRLIVVTFGFLGWAFYELSGGANYQPANGSRQQMAALGASQQKPAARERATRTERVADGAAQVILASAPPAGSQTSNNRTGAPVSDAEKRLRLTLSAGQRAPAQADTGASGIATHNKSHGVTTVAADPEKIARLVAAAGAVRPEPAAAEIADPQPVAVAETRDIRKVKPSRVNMRQGPGTSYNVITKLTQGTEVEVIRDGGEGWVKLRIVDSGRVGWMADSLLTVAN